MGLQPDFSTVLGDAASSRCAAAIGKLAGVVIAVERVPRCRLV